MTVAKVSAMRASLLYPFFAIASILLLLLFPNAVSEGLRNGLLVAYRSVLPAVFPFMVAIDLLLALDLRCLDKSVGRIIGSVFGVSEISGRVILIGMIGGFPIGSRLCATLTDRGEIPPSEAARVVFLSSLVSPAFVITGVGVNMLGDAWLGIKLYVSLFLSHCLIGALTRPKRGTLTVLVHAKEWRPPSFLLSDSIEKAGQSCIKIASYLAFFSVCGTLTLRIIPCRIVAVLLTGTLEIGSGAAAAASLSQPHALPLLSFCLAFSGFSVFLQIRSFAAPSGISMTPYLIGKILSAVSASVITLLFCA